MRTVALKMALRSIGRNKRRTALSLAGISVGCTVAVLMVGIEYGSKETYLQGTALVGAGHLRVVPAEWPRRRDTALRLADPEAALAAARRAPHLIAAAPRVRVQALLAMGTRVEGVELVGVDPVPERRSNRLVRDVVAGRYLAPAERGTVILGEELARRLRVGVDDDLVATGVSSGGRMESAMLRVVGVVTTGNREVDAAIAQTSLEDAVALSGKPGLGEVTLVLEHADATTAALASVAAGLRGGDTAIGLRDIEPTLSAHIEQDQRTGNIFIALAVLLVFLGLAGAQLTAALERRKEFAMLAAIGMKPRQIAAENLFEALVLGLAGSVAALAISLPLMFWFNQVGVDISGFFGRETTVNGLLIEPRLRGGFGPWIAYLVVSLAVCSALLASLYPARFAARVDPAEALRVAQ